MSDIVERLFAPSYWISGSDEGHEGDNNAPIEAAKTIESLRDEIARQHREADRVQDAHGVRFLNYLEETARLTDEIERLRAALRDIHAAAGNNHLIANIARAALGEK